MRPEEIPMRPRARIWILKMTTETRKMLECLKRQNPNIHMDDLSIIRAEQGKVTRVSSWLSQSWALLSSRKQDTLSSSGSADEVEVTNSLPNPDNALKVVQIYLKNSKCATDNLWVLLAEEDLDICLVQEPCVTDYIKKKCSEELTVAKVELPNNVIASSYMAHEKTAPPAEVCDLLAKIGASDDIIQGCDANASHSTWDIRGGIPQLAI
ncbi:hypothetical protein FF38_00734 [Lucilia cuprina]|uniref:Endonuclease/exonuclease/phosphatase domain-containing protein n=1 Tax=Lucilia cuprina TaxID=7375 RepID=A0A0L0CPY2_LUCCU|nr:hypothetical protein FF38_00734 [Lucilia cuprina]